MRHGIIPGWIALAVLLVAAAPVFAAQLQNTSFETGLTWWTPYEYSAPPSGDPGYPSSGCVGVDPCEFSLIPPSTVPDGTNVAGLQAYAVTYNGGVCQTVYWDGGPATVAVTARAYSVKFPEFAGGPYDNGCRVRFGVVHQSTSDRTTVTNWVTFPWGDFWTTRTLPISGPGFWTVFIEGVQPEANAIMSTLWDNVVWTEATPIKCTAGPTVVIPGASNQKDTSVRIQWTTDVASTSKVEYGATSSYGQPPVEDTNLVTNHNVLITGLTHSSSYHFRASSTRPTYAPWTSDDGSFKTPIQFSDISASIAPNGLDMVIMWNTDVETTSQVQYGDTPSYGSTTTEDLTLTKTHSVTLTGLTGNHAYHFRVWGRNNPDYTATCSDDYEFATLPIPETSLQNGSFELGHGGQTPSLYPWVPYTSTVPSLPVRPIDGIVGPYPGGGPITWTAAGIRADAGSYFLGAGSHQDAKNGGVLQRIYVTPNELYTLGARFATYRVGGTDDDNRIRFGIDPDGGVDPQSGNVLWWNTFSPTNNNLWHAATVTARAGTGGMVTVFLDMMQLWQNEWNVIAVDNVQFGTPQEMSIGGLKSSDTLLSVIMRDEIVTSVSTDYEMYNGSAYQKVYIEEPNQSAGTAVLFSYGSPRIPDVGNKITVTGSLILQGMEAMVLEIDSSHDGITHDLPGALAMNQASIGGKTRNQPSLLGHNGLCNVGMRVRVFGRVNWTDWPDSTFHYATAYIDDGSKLLDHTPLSGDPVYGLRVNLVDNYTRMFHAGDYLSVTGVLTVRQIDPDGWENTGDEFYAYVVQTDGANDWQII